ncbi:hypothetical protein O181_000243 [Austropuccinia psidii MF-1]|uniref:Uncharacterized protein n=1 Tax=Austropuccinia psidii MF-1 TaxID=1389203 RepID=A0A9Q3B8G1_9BASI|nr:hypothetical protein [Austropuccinia psidii MF-1]
MNQGGRVSLDIPCLSILVSGIGDWGERAYMNHYRKGSASRILNQLAYNPSIIDSLQYLIDVTLKPDTMYNERKKEKNHFQEANTQVSKLTSGTQNSSSSSIKKKNFWIQKRDKPHSSIVNKDHKLMGSEKERTLKEGLCSYCGGKHSI